jgi:hypothetical protein
MCRNYVNKKKLNFYLLKVLFILLYTMGRPLSQEDIDITAESFEDFAKAYQKDKRVILIPIGIILGFLGVFYFLG